MSDLSLAQKALCCQITFEQEKNHRYADLCGEVIAGIKKLQEENEDLQKLNKNLERQFVEDTEKIRELESLLGGGRPGQVS